MKLNHVNVLQIHSSEWDTVILCWSLFNPCNFKINPKQAEIEINLEPVVMRQQSQCALYQQAIDIRRPMYRHLLHIQNLYLCS